MISNLQKYVGKNAKIITNDDEVFTGNIWDFVSAFDNYYEEDSIIVDMDGYDNPVEFRQSKIKDIVPL